MPKAPEFVQDSGAVHLEKPGHRPNTMFDHIWFWKSRLPERKGQPCRVLVRGRMNSILVEFADGYKVVTSRFAVRKQKRPAERDTNK